MSLARQRMHIKRHANLIVDAKEQMRRLHVCRHGKRRQPVHPVDLEPKHLPPNLSGLTGRHRHSNVQRLFCYFILGEGKKEKGKNRK